MTPCWRLALQARRRHTSTLTPFSLFLHPPCTEHVEFRHPACRPLGAASLAERSARLAGAPCRLLPDLRPALVECLRPADAPTLARLRPLWAAYGQPLPASVEHLAEVRLDCDPDAPTFPYPPCRLLGQDGLATLADRLAAPAVQAVLARLRGARWVLGAGC